MEKQERMHWHPVFASALRLELQEYEDALDIQEEVQLSRKPLQIDILVIRKKRLTVSSVCSSFPSKLAEHLEQTHGLLPAEGIWKAPQG